MQAISLLANQHLHVKNILKVKRRFRLDAVLFQWHYLVTMSLLVFAWGMLIANQQKPINCVFNKHQAVTQDYIDNLCLMNGTYVQPQNDRKYGGGGPVAPHVVAGDGRKIGTAVELSYYGWIEYILIIQVSSL
jgi:hypothetical protein